MTSEAHLDHTNRRIPTVEYAALMRRSFHLRCPRCAYDRLLDAVPLWWLFYKKGWNDQLPAAITRRFYCGRCCPARGEGPKVRPKFNLSEAIPTGPQLPYPDEREWKRLVSRTRS